MLLVESLDVLYRGIVWFTWYILLFYLHIVYVSFLVRLLEPHQATPSCSKQLFETKQGFSLGRVAGWWPSWMAC